jgi:hypothetical protein
VKIILKKNPKARPSANSLLKKQILLDQVDELLYDFDPRSSVDIDEHYRAWGEHVFVFIEMTLTSYGVLIY